VSLVGAVPAAITLGNGIGLPGSYILVALLYLLFSVGFTAMGRYVMNAGAFYAYIAEGFGAAVGVGGAFVAVLSYSAIQVATYALFGIFSGQGVQQLTGLALPWWTFAVAAALVAELIGQRAIVFSGRVLGALLIFELLIVLVLDAAILFSGTQLRLVYFSPIHIFGSGFGASLAFVVPCFLGFEATAIFGEEAEDPVRTIPRATYIAVAIIGAVYAISTWAVMSTYPLDKVISEASTHGSTFFFSAAGRFLGPGAVVAMTVLMITSMFAALLSLHNVIARYLFALARGGLLPRTIARTHDRHRSPHIAGCVQTASMLVIIAGFAVGAGDPYGGLFAWSATLGSLSILLVQAAASLAVVAYFRRTQHRVGLLVAFVAPILTSLGLLACIAMVTINLPLVAGTNAPAIWSLPVVAVMTGLIGYAFARGLSRGSTIVKELAEQ